MTQTSQEYLVSPSQFSTHKKCSFLHEYVYGHSLRPKARQDHFEVGSYFHELAHHLYKTMSAGYDISDPLLLAAIDKKLRKDLEESNPNYFKVIGKVHIMFRDYLKNQAPRIDTGIEILDVEKEVHFPIIEGVSLQGIIDLVYRQKGKLIIRDHKTGANASAHSQGTLELDDQLMTYACIIWNLMGEIPAIEISWINSKIEWSKPPMHSQKYMKYQITPTEKTLTGWWKYLEKYVYYMETVPAIRSLSKFNCKSCVFREPCLFDMRGLDQQPIIDSLFKKVPRNYDFIKFTEISRKRAGRSDTGTVGTINLPSLGKSFSFDA